MNSSTIRNSINNAARILELSSDTPRLDAELLLCETLNCPRSSLITYPLQPLTPSQLNQFNELIGRRVDGEPVAYILGRQGFWTLNLKVTTDVLIPRPETEKLIEVILDLDLDAHNKPIRILDLGTGSGAIALALCTERPLWQIDAVDQSPQALSIAKQNANRYGVTDKQIRFIESNWFYNLDSKNDKYDIIVSNPPYIAPDDHHLMPLRYEPQSALVANANGLEHYITISQQASTYLKPNGYLVFEHGYNQQPAIKQLLVDNRFTSVFEYDDLNQQPRVCGGRLV